jgi:hypothetical protein
MADLTSASFKVPLEILLVERPMPHRQPLRVPTDRGVALGVPVLLAEEGDRVSMRAAGNEKRACLPRRGIDRLLCLDTQLVGTPEERLCRVPSRNRGTLLCKDREATR